MDLSKRIVGGLFLETTHPDGTTTYERVAKAPMADEPEHDSIESAVWEHRFLHPERKTAPTDEQLAQIAEEFAPMVGTTQPVTYVDESGRRCGEMYSIGRPILVPPEPRSSS